jgi:hypothetical protein
MLFNDFDEPNDNDNNEEEVPKLEFLDYGDYRKLMNMDPEEKKTMKLPEVKHPLDVVKFATNKHNIKVKPAMEQLIIPCHPCSCIINGKSGSGKTTLLMNLVTRPEFFADYFDITFFFSPTAESDDLAEYLGIEKKRIITDDFENKLEHIFKVQDGLIKRKTIEKAPKILLIYDDMQSDARFMKSKAFLRSFIANRHSNITTIFLSQSFTRLPRVCRLQASNIMIYPASQSEIELICDEFCPPHTTKKDFMKLIKHATADNYNFLHINMKAPPEQRFRKNLNTYLTLKNI